MTCLSHAGSSGVYLQEHAIDTTMEPRLCASVWPSSEARQDSQQQLAQVVTHFLSVPEAQTGLLVLQQWEKAAGLSTASGARLGRTDWDLIMKFLCSLLVYEAYSLLALTSL